MIEKRRALGRGLDVLLPAAMPSASYTPAPAPTPAHSGPEELPIELIERNPYQTRSRQDDASLAELAASIANSGVLQPILVRSAEGGRFHLIAGERRWLAAQRAGMATIPAVVRQVSNEQALEMTIVENLQREDLNPMDHARAFERLGREFGLTQEQMAQRTGKDRASIANYLRLLKLPQAVQIEVGAGALSFGHAKALLALGDPEMMEQAAAVVIDKDLTVRQTEELVARVGMPRAEREKKERPVDPNVRQAERELAQALGCKVQIRDRKGRGKIVIEYATLEDFDRVVAALQGS
jgi:ParB family transcriptional regulator, chromosome partitioning protein